MDLINILIMATLSWFQALYEYVERLQEHKADKEQVAMEIDVVCKRYIDKSRCPLSYIEQLCRCV